MGVMDPCSLNVIISSAHAATDTPLVRRRQIDDLDRVFLWEAYSWSPQLGTGC